MKEPKLTPEERRLLNKLSGGEPSPAPISNKTRHRERLHDYPVPIKGPLLEQSSHKPMSKLEQNFVHYYTSHYDQVRAAREAGYPAGRAPHYAREVLSKPEVRQAIANLEVARLKRLRVDGDYLLNRILQIALADPNELVQVRIPPCRYCYGKSHLYQRTYAEEEGLLELYNRGYTKQPDGTVRRLKKGDPPFDEAGGGGYDNDLPPNPECPQCHGRGEANRPIIHFKDSRYLTPDGRALYAGAKATKDGFELVMRNQDAAWSFLARFADSWLQQQRAPMGSFDPGEMTTEDLKRVIESAKEMGYTDDD